MVVVNQGRVGTYGYPDVNYVPGGPGCNCGLVNRRGPFVGLSGINKESLLAVAAVYGTLYLLNKMSKGQGLFNRVSSIV